MRRAVSLLLCLLLVAATLIGCSGRRTLSNLAVVEGMSIDRAENGVSVSVQTLNMTKSGNGSEALSGNITINTAESGAGISQALSRLSKDLSRNLFLGQNKITIFSSSVARQGVGDNMDYFVRSAASRPDVLLCVADGAAKDLLESKEDDALVPSENMVRLLENGQDSGMGAVVSVNDALRRFASPTSDIYLPLLRSKGAHTAFAGLALFDGGKMTATADMTDTFGILLMNGKIKSGLLTLQNARLGHIGVELVSCKVQTTSAMENDRLVFRVTVQAQLMLDEVQKGYISAIDNRSIAAIERLAEEKLVDLCTGAYACLQAAGCDGVQAGARLAMTDPAAYQAAEKNWNRVFSGSVIAAHCRCRITKINDNSIRE